MSNLWVTATQGPAYFHGTLHEFAPGDHVTPSSQHGNVVFRSDTSPEHAYATDQEDTAWNYAEKAWHHGGAGHPRVYQVEPLGHVEADPSHDEQGRSRGNFSGDVRSRDGFRVLREMPMPEHMGEPEDWR